MKKIWSICLVCIFMLMGCTNVNDQKIYNEEHKLNTLYYTIFEREDGIDVLRNGDKGTIRYSLDTDKNSVKLENENISLQKSAAADVIYYKDKWYNLGVDVNEDEKYLEAKLYACDLDGKKSEIVYEVAKKELDLEETLDIPKLVIHKDKTYMITFGSLYIGTLEEKPYKVEVEDVWNVFVQDDTLYVFSSGYEGRAWTLLECDLNGNVKNVLYDDVMVTYVDENYMFYKKTGVEEQDKLYILNRKTEEEIFVEDTLNCYGVLYENGKYVFETRKNGYKTKTIYVMDKEGKFISIDHNENLLLELLKDNKIYVSGMGIDNSSVAYFEIKENEIDDLVILEIQ